QTRRSRSGLGLWCHIVVLVAIFQSPFYGLLSAQIHIVFIAIALACRDACAPAPTPAPARPPPSAARCWWPWAAAEASSTARTGTASTGTASTGTASTGTASIATGPRASTAWARPASDPPVPPGGVSLPDFESAFLSAAMAH